MFVFSLCYRGGAELLKKEGNLEVPSWQILVTKPQFVLLSCIAESWVNSTMKTGKVASVPKAVIDSVFYPIGKQTMIFKTTLTLQYFCSATSTHMPTYALHLYFLTLVWVFEDSARVNYIYILTKCLKTTKLPGFN